MVEYQLPLRPTSSNLPRVQWRISIIRNLLLGVKAMCCVRDQRDLMFPALRTLLGSHWPQPKSLATKKLMGGSRGRKAEKLGQGQNFRAQQY